MTKYLARDTSGLLPLYGLQNFIIIMIMTSTSMAVSPPNMTTNYSSTLQPNTTDDIFGIDDQLGHNSQARVGYFYALRGIESGIGLVGNLMVIIAVARYEDLQTATGSLQANLAAADVLACLLPGMSIVGEAMERTPRWLAFCISKETLYVISAFGNILSLIMISIDRLISLSNPFWYHSKMTIGKVLPCQIVIWIATFLTYSLAFTLHSTATLEIPTCFYPFLLSTRDLRLFMLYPFYVFTAITILINIILSIIVWRQGRKIAVGGTTMINQILRRQIKLAKTTGLVFLVYLILTIPNTINRFMVKDESEASIHISYIAVILWHFNSTINPFIYAYRMPSFRTAFRKMLGLKPTAEAPAPPPVPAPAQALG